PSEPVRRAPSVLVTRSTEGRLARLRSVRLLSTRALAHRAAGTTTAGPSSSRPSAPRARRAPERQRSSRSKTEPGRDAARSSVQVAPLLDLALLSARDDPQADLLQAALLDVPQPPQAAPVDEQLRPPVAGDEQPRPEDATHVGVPGLVAAPG